MILDVLMLLSLAACDESCEGQTFAVNVTNNSSQPVSAALYSSDPEHQTPFDTIASGETKMLSSPQIIYTVKVQPVTDWLAYANEEKLKIRQIMNKDKKEWSEYNDLNDPGELGQQLRDIERKIRQYQKAAQNVSCQGFIGLDEDGKVFVDNGKTPNSLKVTCIIPEK
jgi:hypothetical protein